MAATETLTFGPPGEQWTYDRTTRTYNLARGSSKTLTMATTQGPKQTAIAIAPEISALVIVDMQNFFLSPEFRHHPLGLAAVAPTIKVIEKCRAAGIQIIWLNWNLTAHDIATLPASVQRGFSRALINSADNGSRSGLGSELGGTKGRCLMAGSWNADIYAPLKAHVRAEDVHCAKNRISGMWSEEQPLWRYLEGKGVGESGDGQDDSRMANPKRTLLFAGVNTDQCVLGTLESAYNAGWDCILIEDCCATTTEWGREVCLQNISNAYGFVVDSDSLIAGAVVES